MFTYFPPVASVAYATGWGAVWVFLGGFVVMAAATTLAARVMALHLPASYTTELVRQTASLYLFVPYVGVFVGLAIWLDRLGVRLRVAVVISAVVGASGLVAYHRWLKPALRKRAIWR